MKRIDPQFLELLDMVMHRRPDQSAEYSLAEAKCMYSNLTQRDPIVEEDEPDDLGVEETWRAQEVERLRDRNEELSKMLEVMIGNGYRVNQAAQSVCRYCEHKENQPHRTDCDLLRAGQILYR